MPGNLGCEPRYLDERLIDVTGHEVQQLLPPGNPAPLPPTDPPGSDGNYRIDLLVLYTPIAEERLGGTEAIEARIENLVGLSNTYFQNSLMSVRYNPVAIVRYDGITEQNSVRNNLTQLATDPQVKELRDVSGADVVMLVRAFESDYSLCGIASPFNAGNQDQPTTLNVDAERDAFAVSVMAPGEGTFLCENQVFAHELGHVLGAGHEYQGENGGYYKPYSHAWACGDAGNGHKYRSIMWSSGGPNNNAYFFSNPNLVIDGEACGSTDSSLSEINQADNAKAIETAAAYVAAYRPATANVAPGSVAIAKSVDGAGLLLGVVDMRLLLWALAALFLRERFGKLISS